MTHAEAISFLQPAKINGTLAQQWLDLGCGEGTFTYPLAEMLPPRSHIYAVDIQSKKLTSPVKETDINFIQADFVRTDLQLKNMDCIFMSNALHYVEKKKEFIHKIENYLGAEKNFLIIEYDRVHENPWVPFPVSFIKLVELFSLLGYQNIQKLNERPSAYGQGQMYLAQISR